MKNLNIKKMVVSTLVHTIVGTIIIYMLIGPYNETMQKLFQKTAENSSAIQSVLVIIPIILILEALLSAGSELLTTEEKKAKK